MIKINVITNNNNWFRYIKNPNNYLDRKLKKEKEIYLGDMIINLSKIKNKKILKVFKLDFDRLWIHGLVHLFGHDHKKDQDFLKMRQIEKKYFDFVND